jgi:ATP-dependent DNA ligase
VGETLPEFVARTSFKARAMDLSSWLLDNPLPVICERNYEGIRIFLFKSGDNIVISSKLNGVYTPAANPRIFSKLPEFIRVPHRMILDGKYITHEGLFFFDVLQIDYRDVRPVSLTERKGILSQILRGNDVESPYQFLNSRSEIEKFREEMVSRGSQGIVVKAPLSTYGQHDSWLQLKRPDVLDCFVIDFESGPGKKNSWSVGVYSPRGDIVNLGKVESILENISVHRIGLGSVIEIRFRDISEDQKLVGSFITKINHDKTPNECLISQLPKFVLP